MYKANSPRIKDLPEDERPRERLRKYGPESLRDSDLLALILKSGFKGTTAVQLGEQILTAFEGDLKRMADNRPKQFEKIKGVGEAKAAQIVAAFELGKRLARFHADRDKITSPADVADLMMSKMRYLQKEVVCVLCLDTKGGVTTKGIAGNLNEDLTWGKKLLSEGTVFEGTLNASVFHPREIFRFAIEESANSIILVHNHPSGDPQPSQEDIRATKQLIEAGNQIGIKVLDHIIIGDGVFVSLKEENFI
jgi:DNA repair protein RadC